MTDVQQYVIRIGGVTLTLFETGHANFTIGDGDPISLGDPLEVLYRVRGLRHGWRDNVAKLWEKIGDDLIGLRASVALLETNPAITATNSGAELLTLQRAQICILEMAQEAYRYLFDEIQAIISGACSAKKLAADNVRLAGQIIEEHQVLADLLKTLAAVVPAHKKSLMMAAIAGAHETIEDILNPQGEAPVEPDEVEAANLTST